ncbi:unnamed protein product [Parajaminaea phylloscopi]
METSKVNADQALGSKYNPAHYYAYASAGYMTLLSIPLLAFPRILLLLSTPRGAVGQATGDGEQAASAVSMLGPTLTPIEQFTSFSWGISMITLALITIVQTGAIPLTSHPLPDAQASGRSSPYRQPTVLLLTIYYLVIAAVAWTSQGTAASVVEANVPTEVGIGAFGKLLAFPHALLGAWGFWVLLFGARDATVNRKKGGDPNAKDAATSNFPFKNQYADEQKSK